MLYTCNHRYNGWRESNKIVTKLKVSLNSLRDIFLKLFKADDYFRETLLVSTQDPEDPLNMFSDTYQSRIQSLRIVIERYQQEMRNNS